MPALHCVQWLIAATLRIRICPLAKLGLTRFPLQYNPAVVQTLPVLYIEAYTPTPLAITTTSVLQGCAVMTARDSDVSGAISQSLGTYMYCDCVTLVRPSTSTPAIVEYCHDPDTVTVLEL